MTLTVRPTRLSPTEAELLVTTDGDGQIVGTVHGPICRYSTTIEIAYPLRPVAADRPRQVAARVVIPEPSWWDAESPFLYAGSVEHRPANGVVTVQPIRFGLRSLQLQPDGPRWNGKPLRLEGLFAATVTVADLIDWRATGHNLVIVPAEAAATTLTAADDVGMFVLVMVDAASPPERDLSRHPSCLGWLAGGESATVPGGSNAVTGRLVRADAESLTFDLGDGILHHARRAHSLTH